MKFAKLPHQDHADLLDDLETMAMDAYDLLMRGLVKDLTKVAKKQKLAKSDDLPRGWNGEVPRIEVDFNSIFQRTIQKYLDALRWTIMGDAAGKEATQAAISLGVRDVTLPGVAPAAYLDAIDTQAEYVAKLTGKSGAQLDKELVGKTLDKMLETNDRFTDESLLKLQNRLLSAAEMAAQRHNAANTALVHEEAHAGIADGESKKDALAAAAKLAPDRLAAIDLTRDLKKAVETHRTDWTRLISTDVALASGTSTHQVMQEVYGAKDDTVMVAWVAMRDEKACDWCGPTSRRADGSFKLYRMDEFLPTGSNYGRKRKEWTLCIPPAHPNCRCSLVYLPPGFEITKDGDVRVRGKK